MDTERPRNSSSMARSKAKFLKWLSGILTSIMTAVAIWYLTREGGLLNRPPQKPPPPRPAERAFDVRYELSGRFLILGPNPNGLWASKPGDPNRFLWHSIEIRVKNGCAEPVFLAPRDFRLYVSARRSITNAAVFHPIEEGLQFQRRRLPAIWLEPGAITNGTLIFKVPKNKLTDGTDVNKAYNILRHVGQAHCKVEYDPY